MAEPLKNMYNPTFFEGFGEVVNSVYPEFDNKQFQTLIFDDNWEARELKERMRHITLILGKLLPDDFPIALSILMKVRDKLEEAFEYMFFPDFVEVYGLEDFENSIKGLEAFTSLCSSEFAVRPFIVKYPKRMMVQMEKWAIDDNFHVRRLASEGCRPRLPWAMALPAFKKDPAPILPILEQLKNDETDYVRRSVANNLNDIAKDHPAIVLKIANQWIGQNKNLDWVVKHATRTLLKQGNTTALMLFGFGDPTNFHIQDLEIQDTKVEIGSTTHFSFTLINKEEKTAKVRLEYGIYFMKSNGKQNRKIFQIKEGNFEPNTPYEIKRKQHFKNLTTRKHYKGVHKLAIVVNGVEKAFVEFELM